MTPPSLVQRLRPIALPLGGLVAVLVFTQVLPSATAEGGGTPLPILFAGLVGGMITALTAVGIVLIYRTTRVINFAQTAIGAGGAALCFDLMQLTPVPFPVALIAGIAAGAACGVAFDLAFGRRFFRAPRLVLTVLTIVAAGFLSGVARGLVDNLPFFPPVAQRTLEQVQGSTNLRLLMPFAKFRFELPGLPLPFGFAELLALGVALLALMGVGYFLRFTRSGVAVRAMAENADRAALLGISVGSLSTIVWALSGVLSGTSLTLTGLLYAPSSSFGLAPELLLPALAAAILGRMRSIPVTVLAAVAIEILTRAIQFRQPDFAHAVSAMLLVAVAVSLLLQGRQSGGRSEQGVTSSWQATQELRPIPKEMLKLPALRATRLVLLGIVVVAVFAFPFVSPTGQVFLAEVIALNAIIGLSLVVLTGWAGQVSLGQVGFAAIGAVLAAALAQKVGLSFWLAVPLAAVITGGIAALVGLPALRIPGLYLAVATFAFAVAVRDVLFDPHFFGWLLPTEQIRRPTLFVVDFEDDTSMYFFCVAVLALAVVVVLNLRRTRFGRVLIAVRENEANAQSAGIAVTRTKLTAFAVAGMLAGLAGAISTFQQRGITAASYNPIESINIFVQAIVGGVSAVWGAMLGSAYLNGVSTVLNGTPEIAAVLGSGVALLILYAQPGGLIAILAAVRDTVLRILAQRNQIVVPSLFADMDPESLHLRLIPLSAPIKGSGLASIPRRYRLGASMLAGRRGAGAASAESAAIGAAARRAADVDQDGRPAALGTVADIHPAADPAPVGGVA